LEELERLCGVYEKKTGRKYPQTYKKSNQVTVHYYRPEHYPPILRPVANQLLKEQLREGKMIDSQDIAHVLFAFLERQRLSDEVSWEEVMSAAYNLQLTLKLDLRYERTKALRRAARYHQDYDKTKGASRLSPYIVRRSSLEAPTKSPEATAKDIAES